MKMLNRNLRRGTLLFLLLVLIPDRNTLGYAQTPKYDGESIFRGLMLGAGPVAKLFPEYYTASPKEGKPDVSANQNKQDVSANQNQQESPEQQLMQAYSAREAGFFDKFGKDIQSGDPTKISVAMDVAHQTLQSIVREGHDAHGGTGWNVHGHHAAGGPVWLLARWARMSDIEKDLLVARVAQRLSPAPRTTP